MADDITFEDPSTHLPVATHAFGVVPAGTTSAAWQWDCYYRKGQSGPGLPSSAFVLETSIDNGATWSADSRDFTIEIAATLNPANDPEFLGVATWPRRISWCGVAPMRAGCGYRVSLRFAPTLHSGAATETILFRLGVNWDPWQPVALVPDAPSGIYTGLGCPDVSEWITEPTITLGSDEVTLGDCAYIHLGIRHEVAGTSYALDQNDGASAALVATEEYAAVLSAGASGITVTKGLKATAGTAVLPAYPTGELAVAAGRVPYGGTIVTFDLVAVSGRCVVEDAGALAVTVGPGRAGMPGFLVLPPARQTVTLQDDSIATVYLSEAAVANLDGDGLPLASVTTAGGVVTTIVDLRRLLGPEPIRIAIPGAESVADARASAFVPFPWAVDTGEIRIRVPSVGATGSTGLELNLDGVLIATGSVAAQGSSGALTFTTFAGAPGWVTVDCTAATSGGTPAADFEVILWAARKPA